MEVSINLTAVLITLIICVSLYKMCKLGKKDAAKKQKKGVEVPEFVNNRNNLRAVPRTQFEAPERPNKQDIREYIEGMVQKGEGEQ